MLLLRMYCRLGIIMHDLSHATTIIDAQYSHTEGLAAPPLPRFLRNSIIVKAKVTTKSALDSEAQSAVSTNRARFAASSRLSTNASHGRFTG